MSLQKIILVDAHALCYKAFFAVRDLRTSKGEPTNAVFGFFNIIRKLRKDLSPDYMAVCFDFGKKTLRHEKFADYKVQRSAMPEDLLRQMPVIKELVRALQIPLLEKEGYEADDLIGSLAKKFESKACEIIIVTDDKDMYQLVNDHIKVYSSRREAVMGRAETIERFGFGPELIVDYLALAGDASDNIPGVKGVGEVTAKSLLKEFNNLDGILANTDKIKGKMREKIEQGRESALLSRELATLHSNLEIEYAIEDLRVQEPDKEKMSELFKRLEFRTFAAEADKKASAAVIEAAPAPVAKGTPIEAVEASDNFDGLVKEAINSKVLSAVISKVNGGETPAYFLFVFAGKTVYRLPVDKFSALREALTEPSVVKTFYDIKEFIKLSSAAGFEIKGEMLDAMLAGYVLRSGLSAFTIEALAWHYLGLSAAEGFTPALEASVLSQLHGALLKAMTDEKLLDLYNQIELPLSTALADMERHGVSIDTKMLEEMSKSCDIRLTTISARIYEMAGGEFNINSPRQLGQVLFDKLKLPVVKKTKTGPSTDEEVLTKLALKHELPAMILEYRGLAKLKSTYIDALPRMISSTSGCIHCSFNQAGAETGRLSSNNPNLQNIPVRTDMGRAIRKAFVTCGKDRVLLSADYSQIELRLLAHLADEPVLKKAFFDGEDIHQYTAALIFDVPQKEVTSQMRYNAKRINFGIVYGMSAFGLAKDLGLPQREAQAFIDTYFARYPGISAFVDREIQKAKDRGFSETMFGRRRYLPDINSRNGAVRQFAQRQAINTPVQGSAADLIKIAMVRLYEELKGRQDAWMIMTVHDELVFDVAADSVKKVAKRVKSIMESACELSVPLEVTVKAGSNWAEMERVEL